MHMVMSKCYLNGMHLCVTFPQNYINVKTSNEYDNSQYCSQVCTILNFLKVEINFFIKVQSHSSRLQCTLIRSHLGGMTIR